ncbi:hypothetical protein SAMN05518801_10347 [Novosphingobium sp. CF614]|uniref:autotransporter domain-containing protein n=1 Tax=Novosphingobium sp. CF614 TaxID=1884364 RepID=UPI0008F240E6|nr:autotransporter domain-containing protein [Novosphingobium sp. CF614]SFF90346.1 hypothetical protein SAMN05518801_10347 [Novosphingobium sp. CF614]
MTTLARAGASRPLAPMLIAALAAGSIPAHAQDADAAAVPIVAQADEEVPPAPPWTATASAGIGTRDGGPDGTWQALALTRAVGRGYLRGAVMRYHGTLLQADTALPSEYLVGTLAAGGNFADWVVDGWASYGRQDYGRISTSAGSRPSTGASGSDYYALGGDFGRVLRLGESWYLTPTVAGSYAHGRLLRPAPTGTSQTDLETEEPSWSANAAIRLDHAFGARRRHYAGLAISRNWTGNAVSALVAPDFTVEPDELGGSLDSKHYADGWFEASATANMELTASLHLDLFATRGFGMLAGNTTSAGISLRKSF